MASIFSRIISGEIPCHRVAENEHYFAFLDISPLAAGHTLVVPKKETDYIFDMDDADYLGLCAFAKTVAHGIEKVVPCKRIGIAVIGLEVPHAHIHLVPMNSMSDIDFKKPKLKFTADEFTVMAEKIASAI
jgi:histidine triad (HIT) family protein